MPPIIQENGKVWLTRVRKPPFACLAGAFEKVYAICVPRMAGKTPEGHWAHPSLKKQDIL